MTSPICNATAEEFVPVVTLWFVGCTLPVKSVGSFVMWTEDPVSNSQS